MSTHFIETRLSTRLYIDVSPKLLLFFKYACELSLGKVQNWRITEKKTMIFAHCWRVAEILCTRKDFIVLFVSVYDKPCCPYTSANSFILNCQNKFSGKNSFISSDFFVRNYPPGKLTWYSKYLHFDCITEELRSRLMCHDYFSRVRILRSKLWSFVRTKNMKSLWVNYL